MSSTGNEQVYDNAGALTNQYYPGRSSDTVSTISTLRELFDYSPIDPPRPNYFPQLYLVNSNPLVARISTAKQIGQIATTNYSVASAQINANTSGTVFPLKNVIGTPASEMIVSGTGIPDGVTVVGYAGTSLTVSQTLTLDEDDFIYLVPGFSAPFLGEPKVPGLQYLSVYETEPVESLLDIFWESTSVGELQI